MYLHRPVFRLWPTIFAIFLSWPLSGAIWAIPYAVQTIAKDNDLVAALVALPISAYLTTGEAGFPHLREGSAQTNQYPLILPVMAVLLVIASGMIRRGKRPQR